MLVNSLLLLIILLQGYTIYNLRSSSKDAKEIRQTTISPPVVHSESGSGGNGGGKGDERGV